MPDHKQKAKGSRFTDWIMPASVRTNIQQAIPFWLASFLVGFIAVGYTKLFDYAEAWQQELWHLRSWTLFISTPVCFIIAWYLVKILAPAARGSGIPQVMAAIDLSVPKHEKRIEWLLSIRIAITKILSSLVMVLGGGAIGREGPTIQVAASVFYAVHSRIPKSWPKLSNQGFILTGASAGLAAAFNTPLGGVVFAVEELAKIHIRFFRTALFAAVIIAGLTAQALLGPYLYLGYPNVKGVGFSIFFAVAATALVAGVLGSLMCKAILKVIQWKKNFTTVQTVGFLVIAGLTIAGIAFYFNESILGSGKEQMNEALFTNNKFVSWDVALVRMIGPILCFNTGAAGGVFAPSLAAGASIGGFLSGLFEFTGANANLLILCGMVGFLTGVTRTPFTSAILVLEMTDRHSVIFYLMIAAMVSNLAALLVDKRSFYDTLKQDYLKEIKDNQSAVA